MKTSLIENLKLKIKNCNAGMSYVELIVVLSIFSAISSIVLFNYGEFQAKVDVKNLASDIALKLVDAQNASLSGKLPPLSQQPPNPNTWKPSYGVYLNPNSDNKSFIYFTDLNNNNLYEGSSCAGECLDKIIITKGNSVSSLDVFYPGDSNPHNLNDLTVTFVRPDSSAIIKSTSPVASTIAYIQITIVSPKTAAAKIKLYPSGRIQVN